MENQNGKNTQMPVTPAPPSPQNIPVSTVQPNPVAPAAVNPNMPATSTMNQTNQVPTNDANPSKAKNPKSKKKLVLIAAGGFFLLIILILIASLVFLGRPPRLVDVLKNVPGAVEPSPSPTASSGETCAYCDDPDIIKIQEGIAEYDKNLRDANLREDTLRVPTLEWEVSFQ